MARLEYFVVSESCSVDQFTNRVSVFNILETITFARFPAIFPSCVASVQWEQDASSDQNDYQQSIVVHQASGDPVSRGSNFTLTSQRHRVFMGIEGLEIFEPGLLTFELKLNGEHVAEHRVSVFADDDPHDGIDND